jgi:3-phosphoglycerate kinase
MLPEDFLVRDGNTVRCVPSIHSDDEPVDIGVHSLAQLTNLMAGAYSILWVDSLGIGRSPQFIGLGGHATNICEYPTALAARRTRWK